MEQRINQDQRKNKGPVNLEDIAKEQGFFLYMDESWNYLKEEEKTKENKLWYYEIRGLHGFIYPYDELNLAAIIFLTSDEEKTRKIKSSKEVKVVLNCDGEKMLIFLPKHIDKINCFVQSKKKRRINNVRES